jgi:hypothetical protein
LERFRSEAGGAMNNNFTYHRLLLILAFHSREPGISGTRLDLGRVGLDRANGRPRLNPWEDLNMFRNGGTRLGPVTASDSANDTLCEKSQWPVRYAYFRGAEVAEDLFRRRG